MNKLLSILCYHLWDLDHSWNKWDDYVMSQQNKEEVNGLYTPIHILLDEPINMRVSIAW